MNLLFELFRGGIIFEVSNLKEALIAQKSGAVALLLENTISPIHPDGDQTILEEIQNAIEVPLLASFRPGHFVEAEMLSKMGIWGVYADNRFENINTQIEVLQENKNFPLLADISEELEEIPQRLHHFIPVIRGETIEDILIQLQKKKRKEDFVFATGEIETVADVALLRRSGADCLILPHSVFDFPDSPTYLHKLVQASLHFNNTDTLAKILK